MCVGIPGFETGEQRGGLAGVAFGKVVFFAGVLVETVEFHLLVGEAAELSFEVVDDELPRAITHDFLAFAIVAESGPEKWTSRQDFTAEQQAGEVQAIERALGAWLHAGKGEPRGMMSRVMAGVLLSLPAAILPGGNGRPKKASLAAKKSAS